MKSLSLSQLRLAIEVVGTNKKFKDQPAGTNQALLRAATYMANSIPGQTEPQDPRNILSELGYEW